jgi:hypothetical protein
VSAANARDAADDWVAGARLPPDLSGRTVQLVVFESEEDCRYFYPRRAMKWQQQVNTYISRALRGRKGKIVRVAVTQTGYREWLGRRGDTLELRREYADRFQKLLDL